MSSTHTRKARDRGDGDLSALIDARLHETGYARYDLARLLYPAGVDAQELTALSAEFEDLPPDEHAPGTRRFRRYARGVVFPWSGEFAWIPDMTNDDGAPINGYFQGGHNPEYVGLTRTFAALTESARENAILQDIVHFDFAQTKWNEVETVWPIHVGVHLIKLLVEEEGASAVSSPNMLHQDGEPYVFTHLVYRRNNTGGGNVMAAPWCAGLQPHEIDQDDIIARFELIEPLESYGVRDVKLSHYVAPIQRAGGDGPAERAVVLTDFTPMTERI